VAGVVGHKVSNPQGRLTKSTGENKPGVSIATRVDGGGEERALEVPISTNTL
jgi:hypothetical protein